MNDDRILRFHVSMSLLASSSHLPHSHMEVMKLKLHCTAHCLNILRQQLMCTVDIGVLGQIR